MPDHSRQEIFDLYKRVALTNSYGDSKNRVAKWTHDVTVGVYGNPTAEDRAVLRVVIDDFNGLGGDTKYSLTNGVCDIKIQFVPQDRMQDILPEIPVDYTWYDHSYYNSDFNLYDGTIVISTTGTTQNDRSIMLMRAIASSYGLWGKIGDYPESIFSTSYDGFDTAYTGVNGLSPIDIAILKIQMSNQISPGMTAGDVDSMAPYVDI